MDNARRFLLLFPSLNILDNLFGMGYCLWPLHVLFAGVFRVLLIEKPWFMTLFCFLLSLFFWGCGVLLFLFTLFAPHNIYSFRKVNTCWVVAIACAANGQHQPLTIGSHHFQWLGNLPCLTLQPCLTAEQVEQLP